MTVLHEVRTALVALIAAELPGVTVAGHPLAENQPAQAAVWIEDCESQFDWRSIGPGPENRSERLLIDIVAAAYRASARQRDACEEAWSRCEELLAGVEAAVVTGSKPFQLSGTVSFGLISGWRLRPIAVESGWQVTGRARLDAKHYPA